jgi:hypothetical protein
MEGSEIVYMKFKNTIRRLSLLAMFALVACSSGTTGNEKVVATVNGAPITAAALRQEVAGYGKNNPVTRHTVEDQLKVMIEQKLLIQEAVKMGLNEDKRFAETIKTFWEQTIIRNLIEAKGKELSGKIFITDAEISREYERMRYRSKVRAVRGASTQQDADIIVLAMQSGQRVEGEEILGPLFYEDVKGTPLACAFDMKTGETAAFVVNGERIVVCVISKEALTIPPLAELQKQIRESLFTQKRQQVLAEWILTVHNASKVQTYEKELKEIAHE